MNKAKTDVISVLKETIVFTIVNMHQDKKHIEELLKDEFMIS